MFKPFEELCNMIENLNKKAEKADLSKANNNNNHHPEGSQRQQETTCKYCTEVLAKVAENDQKIQLIQTKLELMHSRFDVFERSLEKLLKAATQPKEQPEPEKQSTQTQPLTNQNQNEGNYSVPVPVTVKDEIDEFELIGKNSNNNNPIINNPVIQKEEIIYNYNNDNYNNDINRQVIVPDPEPKRTEVKSKQVLILVPEPTPAVVEKIIEEPEIPKNPAQLKEELISLVKDMEEKQGVGPSLPSGSVSRYRIIISNPEVLELVRNDQELHQKLVKLGKDFTFLKYPN